MLRVLTSYKQLQKKGDTNMHKCMCTEYSILRTYIVFGSVVWKIFMASIPSNGRKYKNVENMCAATNLMPSWETVHTEIYI
jgi:hypothetical protein